MLSFYVYILKDRGVPFYVGKGSGDRCYQHEKDSKSVYYKKRSVHNKINKILLEGRSVEYEFYENLDEQQAFELEVKLIQQFGRLDLKKGTLCNLTDGGDNPPSRQGKQWNDESKLALKSQRRRQRITGNLKKSPETQQKITESLIRFHTNNNSKRIHNKSYSNQPVLMLTLDNQIICSFDSMKEAASYISHKNTSSISNCCSGKKDTAGGYKWIFASCFIHGPKLRKHIIQSDFDGNVIEEFDTAEKAANSVGCKADSIRKCCKGVTKSSMGFTWKYVTIDYKHRSSSKKIIQKTLEDTIIKIHDSVFLAASSVNKRSTTPIYNCCNGKQKTAYGFRWEYLSN